MRRIRHTDLREIENAVGENYDFHTEYYLGVNGDVVFESREPDEACLYIIRGTLKDMAEHRA